MKCTICGGEWQAPEGFEKVTKCIFCGEVSGLLDVPYIDDEDDEDGLMPVETAAETDTVPAQEPITEPISEPVADPVEPVAVVEDVVLEPEASKLKADLPEISVVEPVFEKEAEESNEPVDILPEMEQAKTEESEIVESVQKEPAVEVIEQIPEPVKPPMFNGIPMVLCPAGSYIAGSPVSEVGRWNDEYQHKITISKEFYIGVYPITQAQYCAITEKPNPSIFIDDNNPVDNVDWNEAKQFCEILNHLTENQRPEGFRYDLPTSAQWEYACRAGTTEAFNSGKGISASEGICENLDEIAWYIGNSQDVIHQVGLKKPNKWGIHDMHGNIWEWCRDLAKPAVKVDETDPVGEIIGETHTCRGGSWNSEPRYCRSASRLACSNFDACTHLTGFRVVLQKY